jgi:thioester reductase-like protein
MTQFSSKNPDLSTDEWNELVALKDAINHNPASVHYDRMERFADLMVRTLHGKSDSHPIK